MSEQRNVEDDIELRNSLAREWHDCGYSVLTPEQKRQLDAYIVELKAAKERDKKRTVERLNGIEQARHEWQAAVIEAAASECDKRADELREGAHAHYIDPYTEQRETAYLEAKLLAERLRCRLTTADIAAAREKMIAEAVTVEREKWTKLTHAKSGVTFDLNEIIREAAENTTANLAQGAGQSPGPAEDGQLTPVVREWRCFHCGEIFTDENIAAEHFGSGEYETEFPACIDPLRTDEKERMRVVHELREEVKQANKERDEMEIDSDNLTAMSAEMRRYFGEDCSSMWTAGDRYKSALNLADARREAADLQTAVALDLVESKLAELYDDVAERESQTLPRGDRELACMMCGVSSAINTVKALPRNQAILERYEAQVRLKEAEEWRREMEYNDWGDKRLAELRLKAGE